MSIVSFTQSDWLQSLASRQAKLAELLAQSADEQRKQGYFHTLREICQQPAAWAGTAELMQHHAGAVRACAAGIRCLILTGSGSSEYAGDCVRLPLQSGLGVATHALGGGTILAQGSNALPPGRPALMVSLARSGESPESVGAVSQVLKNEPEIRHLVLTCNPAGALATKFLNEPRVTVITLDEATNDRSLVMTSSFTNLLLAARFISLCGDPLAYREICGSASEIAGQILSRHFDRLCSAASAPFNRALFLGSGPSLAAAREAGLKMLEMTAGRVSTLCETFLGLRHGPMSYVHEDCLVMAFLSSEPALRAYECDLLRELDRKRLGLLKVIVGEQIPQALLRTGDIAIECPGMKALGDDNAAVIHVLAGQILAFFRCRNEGLRPDSPSENGVISRVVQSFALHLPSV